MNCKQKYQLRRIGSLCNRLAELLDQEAEMFIVSRPKLWARYSWDPCPKPKGSRELSFQLRITKNLLLDQIHDWLCLEDQLEITVTRAEEIFNG